jgi:myosin heavy subunit
MSKYYWIPDKLEVWVLGVEIPNSVEPSGNSKYKIISTNKIVSSRLDLCLDAPDCENDDFSSLSPEDLISLPSINQAAILNSTRLRFHDKNIYTSLGSVLMLINPFKRIDKLYGQNVLDKYKNSFAENLPSHIYLVPSRAYSRMCTYGKDQSILISGESGAGKTEATKECLAWLTTFAGTTPVNSKKSPKTNEKSDIDIIDKTNSGTKKGSAVNIAKKIIAASPILEAFGNAQTIRNPNSSRFGKWMQLTFDKSNWITGSSIVSYLLEQSRVTAHSLKERNYHIFYQILRGASDEKLSELHLNSDTTSYKFLSMDSGEEAPDFEDADKYEEMIESFENMGFDNNMIDDILKIIAAVLHLGNLKFNDTNNGETCQIEKSDELKHLSDLLAVSIDSLETALCTRSITSGRKSIITINLNSEKACDSRDSLARALYDKLFKDIIVIINNNSKVVQVSKSTKGSKCIGLLDIFGFEIFQQNSFEQLCINYCNEILQNHFNFVIFEAEKKLYLEEGISCDTIECKDNLPTIQGIQSLFKALDEEGRIPKGSSKTWFDKIRRSYATAKPKPGAILTFSQRKDAFTVVHYAGEVEYAPSMILEKNISTIYNDLIVAMQSSSSSVIQRLFQTPADAIATDQKGKVGNKTISWRFQAQLTSLMAMLRDTDSHFIRCIKSNDGCKPLLFDSQLVQRQLLYSGIFEVVQIQQSGFPCRFTHEDFLNNFKCLVETKLRWGKKTSTCEYLISYLNNVRNMNLKLYEIGKSIVFMKANENQILERAKGLLHNKSAVPIQKCSRMSVPYKIYNKLINNLHEMNSQLQKFDIPALTNNYNIIDECCNKFSSICGYNILKYISIQQNKILQKTIAQKEIIDELHSTSQERSHIGFEKLESTLKKAHELDLEDHSVVIKCQLLVIGFKNAVTFIKNINSQSEITELSLGDIKSGIDNLEDYSDILPQSLPTLDIAAERKRNVEHELEVIFKNLLENVKRLAIIYEKETANLIPADTKDYSNEPSLKDIMDGMQFDTLLCKDTRSLYRDTEVFLQLLNDYIPREAAKDALIYISKQNIFTEFIFNQVKIISQWAEIQMSAQAMKKALSVGFVPGTSLGTESSVKVNEVKKILETLSQFVKPSSQIVIVIMVGKYIIKWREAFINKDWLLLSEISIEVKDEFAESDNIFAEFEESIIEIKNCDEQVKYNKMISNMLMIFDEPEIAIIPVETMDLSKLTNNYQYCFDKITIAKNFLSNSMRLFYQDGAMMIESSNDSKDSDDDVTVLKSIWPILEDLIPVCEDILDLRMQLHVFDLDSCLILCSSLLSQKYSSIIKMFSLFDFIENEIKFCRQIIILIKAERTLHEEMLKNQSLPSIYSNTDDVWILESSSQLSVENSITSLRTAISVINDLEASPLQKTLYSSILPNSLLDKRNSAKKLLSGRESLIGSDITDFKWNDIKNELLSPVVFLDSKNNTSEDTVILTSYSNEFNIIINELTRRSLLHDLLSTLIILPNTLNINGEFDDYFKFEPAIYDTMSKKVENAGKSFSLIYSDNNVPLELLYLHKCCLNLQKLRSYINNNDWSDENKIPDSLTDILPVDIPDQYLKSKLVRDDDNTLISSIKVVWAELNSRFYIRKLKESIPVIGFSYFKDEVTDQAYENDEEIDSESSNFEMKKKAVMINEESFKGNLLISFILYYMYFYF